MKITIDVLPIIRFVLNTVIALLMVAAALLICWAYIKTDLSIY